MGKGEGGVEGRGREEREGNREKGITSIGGDDRRVREEGESLMGRNGDGRGNE